jgi:serine protease
MLTLKRLSAATLVVLAALTTSAVSSAAAQAPYRPGEVIVGYQPGPLTLATRAVTGTLGGSAAQPAPAAPLEQEQVLHLARGESVSHALARLHTRPGIAYAVPNYLAHLAGATPGQWVPDDPGRTHAPGGWQQSQWNFLAVSGINAPAAWANLRAAGHPGGRGTIVAVLDTGVAYRDWKQFRRSPDFNTTKFADPYDFVAGNAYPLDRQGHGTFVTGTIAESTGNGVGLTGIAYGATIMPVRVLDGNGWGDASTIGRGIRYAVAHRAQVINLSLEFDPSVTAGEIPSILSAIDYAHRHGVVVVAASGNEGENQMAYPARDHSVVSVGATTRDRCLADYSNGGHGLDLVAPGGGQDSTIGTDPSCHSTRSLPPIFQLTFGNPAHPDRFSYPTGWYGTSMAAPHVAGVAALVIASGVLGPHPSPSAVLGRLQATAQPLGGARPNSSYGYGLVDAGAATAR